MGVRGASNVTEAGSDDVLSGHTATDATATLPAQAAPTATPTSVPTSGDDAPPPKKPKTPKEPKEPRPKKPPWRIALEWIVLIAIALGIAFLIKSFLFQAFYIPSESMKPTLNVGDRVLVNKLSYDLHDVNRGDIVVFEAPERAQSGGIEDLVKRVIGLPGDTVTADADGTVVVDGRRLKEPYLTAGTITKFTDVPPDCGAPDNGEPGCVVPKDRLLMLGDNRQFSKDSRVFGPIAEDTIVGRVFVRIWPISDVGFL
jgi:signal peptidase I